MKKILFTLMLLMAVTQQSHAVLKEKDLSQTLHVLRLELYNKWMKQKEMMKRLEARQEAQHKKLVEIIKRSETTSLILYSQGQDFTFDMAFACQEATTLYDEVKSNTMPFDQIKQYIETEIANYDSLIVSLKQLPPAIIPEDKEGEEGKNAKNPDNHQDKATFMLDAQGQQDRAMCINYAETLRDNMKVIFIRLERDNRHYVELYNKVEHMNQYAQNKYISFVQDA